MKSNVVLNKTRIRNLRVGIYIKFYVEIQGRWRFIKTSYIKRVREIDTLSVVTRDVVQSRCTYPINRILDKS